MINKKIIKESGKFDLQLFANNQSTEMELVADLQKIIDDFKTVRQDRALKRKKTEGFLVIPKMLEVILDLHFSFNRAFTNKEGRIITCERYGVLEDDLLKTILSIDEEYADYKKWLENQILLLVIRYQVNGKNYLLLAEADKDLNDPTQKYISQALNALKRDKNIASIALEGIIKVKNDEEFNEAELERQQAIEKKASNKKKLLDFTGNEIGIEPSIREFKSAEVKDPIKEIMVLTGATREKAKEALLQTRNKKEAIQLLNNQKIKEQARKAVTEQNEIETSLSIDPAANTLNKLNKTVLELAFKYPTFDNNKIKNLLIENEESIEKTELILKNILLARGTISLKERYPYIKPEDIDQIIKNESSLEGAREILEIENSIRKNTITSLIKDERAILSSAEKDLEKYREIVRTKGTGAESNEALDSSSKKMDILAERVKQKYTPAEWAKETKDIAKRLSYIKKPYHLPQKPEMSLKKEYQRDNHGQIVGIKYIYSPKEY